MQPVKEFGALYEQALAPESGEELMRAGRAITDTLRRKFPDLFEGVDFSPGPLKEWDRSVVKLLPRQGKTLDPERADAVLDLVRGRIVIDNADQVRAIRTILADDKLRGELGIASAHDRFANPSSTHYRDINMGIRLVNGHIAEIQVNQRDMLAAAEFTHDPYEDAHAMEKRAQIGRRLITADERLTMQRLTNYAQDVHNLGAARFAGADDLLNNAGRARLARDYAARRAGDPSYEPGNTVQTGHKYDALLVNGAPPIDLAKEAYGGIGAGALRDQAGIKLDRITIDMVDTSMIRTPDSVLRAREAAARPHLGEVFSDAAKRGLGLAAGVVVGGTLAADGADAREIVTGVIEATVPLASAGLAAAEGRYSESLLRVVEEIPLAGLAMSEVARPVAQEAGLDVDPSIGQTILSMGGSVKVSPEQQRFTAIFDGLPHRASDDMPPEVASLAEFKGLVLKSEERLEASGPAQRAQARTALEAAEQRYAAQYGELVEGGGISEVQGWISQNGAAPIPEAPAAEPLRRSPAAPALAR